MLRLNVFAMAEAGNAVNNSNTTNVKVKQQSVILILAFRKNSNTTNVKVKRVIHRCD